MRRALRYTTDSFSDELCILLQYRCCNSFAFHVAAEVYSWIDCARRWAAMKADPTLKRRVALSGKPAPDVRRDR